MPVTLEQLNESARSHGKGLVRHGLCRNIDEEARTIEVAFSSEEPYGRWFGEEILDHSPGAMRRDRLDGEAKAPVLVNHDLDDQVGVVMTVTEGEDRKNRATLRFGSGARASEVFQDIVDGIRTQVSVAYQIHKYEVEERDGQASIYRMTDWEPYEISIVSVAADPTVGVGRSIEQADIEQKEADMSLKDKAAGAEASSTPDHEIDDNVLERATQDARAAATEEERERVASLMRLGEAYDAQDLARDMVKDGKSLAEMERELNKVLQERLGTAPVSRQNDIGLSDKEVRQYSIFRAIRALANPTDRRAQEDAAFEFECSDAVADREKRAAKGVFIPQEITSRSLRRPSQQALEMIRALNTAVSGTAAGDTGGFTVATDLLPGSFIDILHNNAVALQLGTMLNSLVGNVDIPAGDTEATGFWLGEDAEAQETTPDLRDVSLTNKTVGGYAEITRKLLQQSSIDVESWVERKLAVAMALAVDKACFYGTGTAFQPLGIKNLTGVSVEDFGVAGALPTYGNIVNMESEVAAANVEGGNMAYVMNAKMRGHLKQTEKFPGSSGMSIWEPGNTVNGYPAPVTNQIDDGDVFFGRFDSLMIGTWGALDLNVDDKTHSRRGRLRIVAMQDADVAAEGADRFCYGAGIAP